MATLAEIEAALRAADAAGAEDDARALARAYQAMSAGIAPPANDASGVLGDDPLGRLGQAAHSTVTGALQGATMGAYDELASFIGAPIKGIENLVTGQDSISGLDDVLPFLGRSFQDARAGQVALNDIAFEQAPAAYIAGDIGGSIGLGTGMAARGATMFGDIARPTIVGMGARGALEGGLTGAGTGYNTAPEDDLGSRLTSAAIGGATGAGIGALTGGVLGSTAGRAQSASVPSVNALKQEAGDLYEIGRTGTFVASPQQSQKIADDVLSVARRENVILPNGKMNQAYAPLGGILDTLDAYAGRPVTFGEIQKIRDTIRDVVASPEPGVQRIALDMLDEFNDYAVKIYPDLAKADDLFWRAKTGELIELLGDLATTRSGQYTQSGMENALRAEFRAIERQIKKGRVKGIPKELAEQISKVARGDSIQDAARWVSRFGMRNPWTMAGGTTAGILTGSAPVAAAVWGAGQLGAMTAEALAKEKYRIASALARSGGDLPSWTYGPGAGGLVQGGSNLVAQSLAGLQ